MPCQQESTGNQATEKAPIVADAAQKAVRSSVAVGEAFCNEIGSCSEIGETCSYTVTSGSVTIVPIVAGDEDAYSATATTNGKCECKTSASETPGMQQPTIKTFTFSPPSIPFGDVSKGTIILTGPAPSNTSISLLGVNENGNPDGVAERAAEFPATVAVPPNAEQVTFEAKRKDGAGAFGRTVRIKASYLEGTIVVKVRVEGLPT